MIKTKTIKSETLTIRVTPEEKEQIRELAEMLDVTVSKLLYNLLFKDKVIEKAKNR